VRQARATAEIQTLLQDTQVAKLFIFPGDGIAISYMPQQQTSELQHKLKASFDALYHQLIPLANKLII
jgi:hypothetical protein